MKKYYLEYQLKIIFKGTGLDPKIYIVNLVLKKRNLFNFWKIIALKEIDRPNMYELRKYYLKGSMLEFSDDKSALLWFKLNY